MARIIEYVDADSLNICPLCRNGHHDAHFEPIYGLSEGPKPEPGACWAWERETNTLCVCSWRPDGRPN